MDRDPISCEAYSAPASLPRKSGKSLSAESRRSLAKREMNTTQISFGATGVT